MKETQISRQIIHTGKVIDLVRDSVDLPSGRVGSREIILHNGGVVILPYDSLTGLFTLVKQFRYATGDFLLEFPAGRLELGEDPLEAAKRELGEETGLSAKSWSKLGEIYPAPGFCSEKLFLFLATDLTEGEPNPDEDECLEIIKLSEDDLKKKLKASSVIDAKTIAAYSFFHLLTN